MAGAWIVAGSARRRERRVAAGMILPDLQQLAAARESLETALDTIPKVESFDAEQQQAHAHAHKVIEELDARRPRLFALHTPAIGQLSDIDARLYSHLLQCRMIHQVFDEGMEARRAQGDALRTVSFDPTQMRPIPPAPSNRQLYADWRLCAEHAMLANYFLDRLVFSRGPRWYHRTRMTCFPNEFDKRSEQLLRTGTLPAATAITATV